MHPLCTGFWQLLVINFFLAFNNAFSISKIYNFTEGHCPLPQWDRGGSPVHSTYSACSLIDCLWRSTPSCFWTGRALSEVGHGSQLQSWTLVVHPCAFVNLSVKELLSWEELGIWDATDSAAACVSQWETWLPGTFCRGSSFVIPFTGFQPRRRCFSGGAAPDLPDAFFLAFLHNFDAFAFSGCSGTGTAERHHHHYHHIYLPISITMSIIKNSYTVGRLPEKPYCHWLTTQVINECSTNNIIQYEGTETKTTKLCANAIGLYVQYHHLIYNSHTIQSK